MEKAVESHDRQITLIINSTQGEWKATFPKTTKVSEVLEAARKHFGFSEGGNYQLKLRNGEVMRPERTLESYHLNDGDHVVFTDLGSAA